MDNKHLTALLDRSKAFDSIKHNILPQKLRSIGVSKTTLETILCVELGDCKKKDYR